MLYGPEKVREIARSILPSCQRRGARSSAAMVKRVNRRRTRQTLHEWAKYDDPYEFEGHVFDYDEPGGAYSGSGWYELASIKDVMWRRREFDKLGAFLRWADAHTAHLETNEERYLAVKRAMPDSLIGRHALTHLGPDSDTDNPTLYGINRYNHRIHDDPDPWRDPDTVRARIQQLLEEGRHKDLNGRLIDPLKGAHDLERLVGEVCRYESQARSAVKAIWESRRAAAR